MEPELLSSELSEPDELLDADDDASDDDSADDDAPEEEEDADDESGGVDDDDEPEQFAMHCRHAGAGGHQGLVL